MREVTWRNHSLQWVRCEKLISIYVKKFTSSRTLLDLPNFIPRCRTVNLVSPFVHRWSLASSCPEEVPELRHGWGGFISAINSSLSIVNSFYTFFALVASTSIGFLRSAYNMAQIPGIFNAARYFGKFFFQRLQCALIQLSRCNLFHRLLDFDQQKTASNSMLWMSRRLT